MNDMSQINETLITTNNNVNNQKLISEKMISLINETLIIINNNMNNLSKNQEVINEKINSLIDAAVNQQNFNISFLQQIENIRMNFDSNINVINNKFSDLQILIQNDFNDIDNITHEIQSLSSKLDDIKFSIDQWIKYSENVYSHPNIIL